MKFRIHRRLPVSLWCILICGMSAIYLLQVFHSAPSTLNSYPQQYLQRYRNSNLKDPDVGALNQENEIPYDPQKKSSSNAQALKNATEFYRGLKLPMQTYTIQNCSCVRFGYSIDAIRQFQRKLKGRSPDTKPSSIPQWFIDTYGDQIESTCSDFATQKGRGQQVFSYSYYNPMLSSHPSHTHFKKYLSMLHNRAKHIQTHFPDWTIRLYHNVSESDVASNAYICRMYCALDNVDICHIKELPTIGNLQKKQPIGRMWRFAVMGDPTVSIFNSRDTDSFILSRERKALSEWLESGKAFHVMRDHPHHRAVMLAANCTSVKIPRGCDANHVPSAGQLSNTNLMEVKEEYMLQHRQMQEHTILEKNM